MFGVVMRAHKMSEATRHVRSTHAIAGVVVLLNAVLAWVVATFAVSASTTWPLPAILPLTLVFGLLVGAVTRAIASDPTRGWSAVVGRGAVAVAVGVVVGELAALVLFSGSIDRQLDEQAARNAGSVPAVEQASADLDRTRTARTALDDAVEQARTHRDQALVVARCEYNPSPTCPETRITGVPGVGPETRTANDFLADAQQELDNALAARDQQAPALDAAVTEREHALAQARDTVVAGANHGLGARWVAMQDYTFSNAGALLLRLLTVAFFALLSLLPLILRLWRGETSHDRAAAARAERDRAQLEADTAIAVKQAEVRAAAEILWAEQQLANTRFAVEAQTEIDRAQQRRRVAEVLDGPVHVLSQRTPEPVEENVGKDQKDQEEDMFLPIAAEAEAASRAAAQLPAGRSEPQREESLPVRVESDESNAGRGPAVPTIPEVTKAAARWIRPLVPPFVAWAIDTTAHPLRSARQAFEEFEEITFTLKRTHKVTFNSEESAEQPRLSRFNRGRRDGPPPARRVVGCRPRLPV